MEHLQKVIFQKEANRAIIQLYFTVFHSCLHHANIYHLYTIYMLSLHIIYTLCIQHWETGLQEVEEAPV